MQHPGVTLAEIGTGAFAMISAASFNNVCAGIGALAMGAYYAQKWWREHKRGRSDSEIPFPHGRRHYRR